MPSVPIDRRSLPNGLRVVLSRDPRAPVVAVNLWYAVGSKNEKTGKTGFAHLFEHMMFQGSAHVEKGQHFSLVQGAGGTLNATTSLDRTNYFETLPSHQLELALWLEADRMANLVPAITEEKLDNQREVVKNERRWSVDNQPYGTWDEKLQELAYPESHPYHHSVIGSMEDLEAASLHDVTEFFETFYRPNNAVLTLVGDFEPDKAMAMIERHFGPIPANPSLPPQPNVELDPLPIGREVREVVPDKVPLPRVYLAYRIPIFGSATFDALEVGADLLGRGRASRLYAALVRGERLAQDVEVYPLALLGGASIFGIWATARPEIAVDRLEAAIHREIGRLVKDGARDDELDRVRNLHDSSIASSLEQVSERADRLSMYTTLFDEPERINAEMSRYDAVTAAQARDGLATYLRDDNQVAVTYVPAEPAEEAA
ncbi:MAG: insulinase family protein [Chloroflexi bacterium]|nr:MAG: insulinase family protein [Chloroflexota bacterium]